NASKANKFEPRRKSANSEWWAELHKEEEDERIAEWSKNYQDRITNSSRMSEKRKQLIANCKYFHGDMEHTHLVKD
uniref:RED-like N-terminal domain-containing protein n=1 Tax=Amphimedon queenslandica TaxID=400682 RepID=A0A1X7TMX3_AMPQE